MPASLTDVGIASDACSSFDTSRLPPQAKRVGAVTPPPSQEFLVARVATGTGEDPASRLSSTKLGPGAASGLGRHHHRSRSRVPTAASVDEMAHPPPTTQRGRASRRLGRTITGDALPREHLSILAASRRALAPYSVVHDVDPSHTIHLRRSPDARHHHASDIAGPSSGAVPPTHLWLRRRRHGRHRRQPHHAHQEAPAGPSPRCRMVRRTR